MGKRLSLLKKSVSVSEFFLNDEIMNYKPPKNNNTGRVIQIPEVFPVFLGNYIFTYLLIHMEIFPLVSYSTKLTSQNQSIS